MRIVDDSLDDGPLFIRKGSVALSTVHLVAAAHLGNRRTAAGTRPAVLDDLGDCGDQCRITGVLHALRLPFTASATELGRARSTLVGRAQESAAGFCRAGRDKEPLLFDFFGLFCGFRTVADVALVTALLGLDSAQHRLKLGFLGV